MFWLWLTFGIVVLTTANAEHPFWIQEIEELPDVSYSAVSRNSENVYRLPENVVPLNYDIYIDLYFDERQDRPFSYDGMEFITIQVRTLFLPPFLNILQVLLIKIKRGIAQKVCIVLINFG